MEDIYTSPMRAWQYHTSGDPQDVLKLEEKPVPRPSDTQVLVKVKCAALNPIGWKSMKIFPSVMIKKPAVAEMDLSGVVVATGAKVTSLKAGDEVYGIIPGEVEMRTNNGALSQYTVVEEAHLVKKPENITWQEAAAIPLAALTAIQSFQFGGLKAGQRVFINGGSGGVGSSGVLIAKALGAFVVSTCSDRTVEFVRNLGADEVIDYKTVNLVQHLKEKYASSPFDLIFDCIGTRGPNILFDNSPAYLQENGTFVQIGSPMESLADLTRIGLNIAANSMLPAFLGGVPRKYKFLNLAVTKQNLEALNEIAAQGKLKIPIDSEHAFEDALKAYERIMSNRAIGKIIVNVS